MALYGTEVTRGDKTYKYGDVNTDGKFNVQDVTSLQFIVAESVKPSQLIYALSDVTADGVVDIRDVTMIQRYISGIREDTGKTGEVYKAEQPTQPTQPAKPTEATKPSTQLVLENVLHEELEEIIMWCIEVGLPVTLEELGAGNVTDEQLMEVG